MATHKSAEKRARQTIKRTERNIALKSKVRSAVKAYRTALTGTDKTEIEKAFHVATRELRKAGTKGVMHKRTVSRRVSRLATATASAMAAAAK